MAGVDPERVVEEPQGVLDTAQLEARGGRDVPEPGMMRRVRQAAQRPRQAFATVSFTVDGIVPETIVRQMNAENIFLWSGHNYAWEIVHQLGIPAEQGVVRIGIAHYNTAAEIDETLESVHRVIAMLRQQRS